METNIDYEKIFNQHLGEYGWQQMAKQTKNNCIIAMQQAVVEAKIISLQRAAEEVEIYWNSVSKVDFHKIIRLIGDEKLNKQLGL